MTIATNDLIKRLTCLRDEYGPGDDQDILDAAIDHLQRTDRAETYDEMWHKVEMLKSYSSKLLDKIKQLEQPANSAKCEETPDWYLDAIKIANNFGVLESQAFHMIDQIRKVSERPEVDDINDLGYS